MALRLSEAQQLLDVLNDPLFKPAMLEFLREQHTVHVSMLLNQIREKDRDTMKEAALAGKVDAYETLWADLKYFAERTMKEATQ